MVMEWWQVALIVGALLWFPPTRGITKLWIIASVLLVAIMDAAASDVLGD